MYKENGRYKLRLDGDLDVFSADHEDEIDGVVEHRREVMIHGDPQGLRSLAALLMELADVDQEAESWPEGAREHVQLRPGPELAASSDTVILGRLDAKGTGAYYERFAGKPG